jgi:hypothetical protein
MNLSRDINGNLIRPIFKSDVPNFLLEKCTDAEKWTVEAASMERQQNEWIINALKSADDKLVETERLVLATREALEKRFQAIEDDIKILKSQKLISQSQLSVVSKVIVFVIVPAALVAFGALLAREWGVGTVK